jgi:DNA-binding YbaB/EbfC family protein
MTTPFVEMLMQQAEKMQGAVKKVQEELEALEITGSAAAGMIKVTLDGKYNPRSLQIDDSLLQKNKTVLQDSIVAAFQDAVRQVAEQTKGKMSDAASGLGFPAHFLNSLNISS